MSNSNQEPSMVIVNNTSNAMGIASFIFGLLSIFVLSPIFVPLSILTGVVGILRSQTTWSALGLICASIGLVTSPILLTMLGLSWL